MTPPRSLGPAAALAALVLAAAVAPLSTASAQSDQDRRLDRLDKELRELRAIVFQGRDTGQPVVVKPAGPDPAVEALQGRADQEDQTVRTLSGRVEEIGHDLDELRKAEAADHDAVLELTGEVKALTLALARQAPAAPGPDGTPPPPPAGTGAAPPPPAAPATEAEAFRAARAPLDQGDYASAAQSLQSYLSAWPSGAHVREADYLLGEADFGQNLYVEATAAYARALRDWPKTAWAPDATVKLARALTATGRAPQACAALAKFQERYAAGAPRAERARAAAAAVAAKCPA